MTDHDARSRTRRAPHGRRAASKNREPATPSSRTADALSSYMRDVGRVPLLSRDRETCLAMRVEAGRRAATELGSARNRAANEVGRRGRRALESLIREGDEAARELVEANLRIVVAIAKRFRGPTSPMLDLVQEGNLGLMRAVELFDYRKGFRFSTYAAWWIRHAVAHAAMRHRVIRVPDYVLEELRDVARAREVLAQEYGREATVDDLARHARVPVAKILEIQRHDRALLSLDAALGEDEASTLLDRIEDVASECPPDGAARRMLSEAIDGVLGELSETEARFIRLRFGLDDGKLRTLEELARILGGTRARMEYLEARILRRIRASRLAESLHSYLET